jgi:CRP-like cAMP-binding protein
MPLQMSEHISSVHPSLNHTSNRLLATLPAEDRQRVLSHVTSMALKLKQVLYKQDEVISHVIFPCGGACSLTKVMQDGQIAEIATVGNEGVLGTGVFFGDERAFGEAIVQVADGDGLKMPVNAFLAEMDRRGAFYNRIIRYSQALTSQIMQTTVCNGLHSAEQRCCRWLLMTYDRVGSSDLRLTHEFLAIMLGVRRPTVTLILGELQKAGLVDHHRGTIHVVDRPGLEAACCECYATVKATFARLLPEMRAAS